MSRRSALNSLTKGQKVNKYKQLAKLPENEIAPIPPIWDIDRRTACEVDPVLWLKTYLPEVYFCEFSTSQEDFIRQCWESILVRGSKNINAYRGFGKTSILAGLLLMSHLTGHTRHALFITAEGGASTLSASEFFQAALYEDYLTPPEKCKPLAQDYPEVFYPVQRRGGVAQRPLKYRGEPVSIKISPTMIALPTIKGSPSSGSVIRFTSIGSSSIRGSHKSIRGEGEKRVDIVFLDDIQSDGTAKSDVEVTNIMNTINSTLKMLAGRTKSGGKESLIVLSALTQNQQNDVAVRIIAEHPEFCTSIIRFLPTVPQDYKAWIGYREYRDEIFRKYAAEQVKARKLVTRYYLNHRAEIDEGCTCDNPQLYEDWQASAVQFALDIWSTSIKTFWCELQNDSIRAAQETSDGLVPIVVQRKTRPNCDNLEEQRPLPRYWIPEGTDVLTAFIDCGEHYLNYQVTAFRKDFSMAHVVDFGIWPEQPCAITKKTFVNDIQVQYTEGDRFDRLSSAIVDCLRHIFTQQYFDWQGRPIEVHRETDFFQHAASGGSARQSFRFLSLCGVDAGDGEMETAVWRAVDRFHQMDGGFYRGRAIPTYGHATESRLMRYWVLKRGEWRRGMNQTASCDWIENPERCRGIKRRYANVYASLLFDANTAKTRRNKAWLTPTERPGAETLFAWHDSEYLQMFAQQQCSETYKECYKSNLLYQQWFDKKPHLYDNEFLDTDAGCWALANYIGCDLVVIPEHKKLRPTLSREQARAIAERRLRGGK
ncbi:MAG: hypothetical protein ACOX6D_02640 [Thermoguttaceae bacterium]|jgi:hypothetical protein